MLPLLISKKILFFGPLKVRLFPWHRPVIKFLRKINLKLRLPAKADADASLFHFYVYSVMSRGSLRYLGDQFATTLAGNGYLRLMKATTMNMILLKIF